MFVQHSRPLFDKAFTFFERPAVLKVTLFKTLNSETCKNQCKIEHPGNHTQFHDTYPGSRVYMKTLPACEAVSRSSVTCQIKTVRGNFLTPLALVIFLSIFAIFPLVIEYFICYHCDNYFLDNLAVWELWHLSYFPFRALLRRIQVNMFCHILLLKKREKR